MVGHYCDLIDLFLALLNHNPQRRPQSIDDILQTFKFLQPREGDLSEEQAKVELRQLVRTYNISV